MTAPTSSDPGRAGGPAIRLAGLRRDYGDRPALDGVALELASGESLVVLGPNGAGKTTLLRILATLLRPSGGEAVVLGCALPREAWKLRGRIGYLGHEPLMYRDLSGRENLRFQARLHGIRGERAEARIAELLLLDEPDSNLDVEGREVARGLIGPGAGRTRVIVTHDPERFLPEADQVLRLGIGERAAVS